MAVRIAIANHKGGVGKSTSTMMIAEGLALAGGRVLVLDCDPQATASKELIGTAALEQAQGDRRTLGDMLRQYAVGHRSALAPLLVRGSDLIELRDARDRRCLNLLASSRDLLSDLRELEDAIRRLHKQQRPDVVLAHLLEPELRRIEPSYDAILFDCPAGAVTLSQMALRLCRQVIAPTNLEANSYSALADFIHFILNDDLGLGAAVRVHVLLTMYDAGNPAQRQLLDQIRAGMYDLNQLPKVIPQRTAIQLAALHPGPGAFRSAREKYGAALGDVLDLAKAVSEGILTS